MVIIIIIIIIIIITKQFDDVVEHTISACPILAKEQYIQRHERCVLNCTVTYARK
jgi:hypothetical protein